MRTASVLLCAALLALSLPTSVAIAAAPANDDFAAAAFIDSAPSSTWADLTDSTFESGEDQHAHALNVPGKGSVWYLFDAPPGRTIYVDVSGSPADTGFAVYTDENGVPAWTGWAGDAATTVQMVAPGPVYIQLVTIVSDWAQLNVALAPSNDNLADATVVSVPFEEWIDISLATTSPDEPQGCGYFPYTVWYSYTPERDENVLVSDDGDASYAIVMVRRADDPEPCLSTIYPWMPAQVRLDAGVTYLFELASYSAMNAFISLQPGTPILEASLSWDAVSTVTKNGGLILRGEMVCNMSGGASVSVWARQRAGRMKLITGYATTSFTCEPGSNRIEILIYGDGPFNPGSVDLSWDAGVNAPDNQHQYWSGLATIRLRR